MQVDIGENQVCFSFSGLLSSTELLKLHRRLNSNQAANEEVKRREGIGPEDEYKNSSEEPVSTAVRFSASLLPPPLPRTQQRRSRVLHRSHHHRHHHQQEEPQHQHQLQLHGSRRSDRRRLSQHFSSAAAPEEWSRGSGEIVIGGEGAGLKSPIFSPSEESLQNATLPPRGAVGCRSAAPRGMSRLDSVEDGSIVVPAAAGARPGTPATIGMVHTGRSSGGGDYEVARRGVGDDGGAAAGAVQVQKSEIKHAGNPASVGGESGGSDHAEAKSKANAALRLTKTKMKLGVRLKKWIIINRIGAGAFGETFTAVELDGPTPTEDSLTVTPEALAFLKNLPPPECRREVCVKVEQEKKNALRLEILALKKVQSSKQVVRYLGSGCTSGMNYLVMEKKGPNLADLRRRCACATFNTYTVTRVAISCITAIRDVHEQGLVHRDIKPSNFVTGLPGDDDFSTIYLIDFGLARRFRRSDGEIRSPREDAGFRGTSRYASLASHHHHELGRVDDLWSLLFMLVEFTTGMLPWRKFKEKDDIGKCKEETIGPTLLRHLPREFQPFLAHLQTLRYEDEPDYDLLLSLMYRALERRAYPPNKLLDWEEEYAAAQLKLEGEEKGSSTSPGQPMYEALPEGPEAQDDRVNRLPQAAQPPPLQPQSNSTHQGKEMSPSPPLPGAEVPYMNGSRSTNAVYQPPLNGHHNLKGGVANPSGQNSRRTTSPEENLKQDSSMLRISDVDVVNHVIGDGGRVVGSEMHSFSNAAQPLPPYSATGDRRASAIHSVEGRTLNGGRGSSDEVAVEDCDMNAFSPRENDSDRRPRRPGSHTDGVFQGPENSATGENSKGLTTGLQPPPVSRSSEEADGGDYGNTGFSGVAVDLDAPAQSSQVLRNGGEAKKQAVEKEKKKAKQKCNCVIM